MGGIPNPGLGGDPNMAAAQNVDPNVTVSEGWSDKRSESLTQTLMGGGAAADATDSVIGLGTRSGRDPGAVRRAGRRTGTRA